ncbi:hypothetical protein QP531_06600 [Peptoniphilus harei]|uniref:hypothetical protein n=1 Tax=Peptoniphilus harei TaxID=54005 RepID=UPI00254B8905|nr:hypothetical protein [Peptoniphilus harei]MDK7377486.1 hypothetical protein [Peptoniphilus harei]MDK7679798.1 hypothetical protein [Peptoniphilus harei]
MKTDKLVEELKELGYIVEEKFERIIVRNSIDWIVVINTFKIGSINTQFDGFDRLPDERKIELLNIINKYCTTPIPERNLIKKYLVRAYYEECKEIEVEAYNEVEARDKGVKIFYEKYENIFPEDFFTEEIK